MRFAVVLFAWIGLPYLAQAEHAAPIAVEVLEAPKAYGVVMGEPLTQTVRITVPRDYVLDTTQLPQPGSAVDEYLELRAFAWTQEPMDSDVRYQLRLTYQVFKGVRVAETIEAPALNLRFLRGEAAHVVQVPSWRCVLNPIIPAFLPDETVVLAPDQAVLPLDEPSVHPWLFWLAALFFLLGYAAWRLRWPPFAWHRSVFAHALAVIRACAGLTDAAASQRALGALHRALDQTAGYRVFPDDLERFLKEHPCYRPVKAELREFFALSDRFFYAQEACSSREQPTHLDTPSLLRQLETLCCRLKRLERQA